MDYSRRRAQRHNVDCVTCDLGEIVDLSRTGMRVHCPRRPPLKLNQTGPMTLSGTDGRLKLQGRVAWIRRRGLRAFAMGIESVNTTRQHEKAIENLATFGFFRAGKGDGQRGGGADPAGAGGAKGGPKLSASVNLPDYYEVLGIEPDAAAADVKRGYHEQAQRWHPDVCRESDAVSRMQLINEAYAVLRNPTLRATYDMRSAG